MRLTAFERSARLVRAGLRPSVIRPLAVRLDRRNEWLNSCQEIYPEVILLRVAVLPSVPDEFSERRLTKYIGHWA